MSDTMKLYLREMARIPRITPEEEISLSKRIQAGDVSARDKMVNANLRLVVHVAKKYQKRGCSLEDLIQEGNIGLMKAADKFDWKKKCRFSTYATWWIRQAVGRHVSDHGRDVRVPSHITSLYSKIKKIQSEFADTVGYDPSHEEILDALRVRGEKDINLKKVKDALKNVRFEMSIYSPGRASDGDSKGAELLGKIPDEEQRSPFEKLEKEELLDQVRRILKDLSPKEEKIMRLRFGIVEDPSDHEAFPITREEVKMIQKISEENDNVSEK